MSSTIVIIHLAIRNVCILACNSPNLAGVKPENMHTATNFDVAAAASRVQAAQPLAVSSTDVS